MNTKYPMPAELHTQLYTQLSQLFLFATRIYGMIEAFSMLEKILAGAPDVKLENISYSVAENCFYVKEEKKE